MIRYNGVLEAVITLTEELAYKQAKEDPEINAICVDPGWVKTGKYRALC